MWYYFVFYLKCAVFGFTDFIHINLFYHIHIYHFFTIQKKIGQLKLIYCTINGTLKELFSIYQ